MSLFTRTMQEGIAIAVLAVCGFGISAAATHAAAYTGVDVRIENGALGTTTYHDTVYVSSDGCTVEDNTGAAYTLTGDNALCALDMAAQQGAFTYALSYFEGFGFLVDAVGESAGDATNYWLYYVNYESPAVGMSDYNLVDGDELLLVYGGYTPPLRLTVDRTQRRVGAPVTATVEYYSFDYVSNAGAYLPVAGGTVYFGDAAYTTDVAGKAVLVPSSKGTYAVYATADGYTKTSSVTVSAYTSYDELTSLGKNDRKKLTEKGVSYLLSSMDDGGLVDGSIGMTEWSAIALAAAHAENKKLFDAVKEYQPAAADGASELSRHILALEAIGVNARDFRGVDYVARLKNTIVDNQFGDALYCNDDIFAVDALLAADEPFDSDALRMGASFTLNCVNEHGGVGYAVGGVPDVDTTAAWLSMAARLTHKKPYTGLGLQSERAQAVGYLRAAQNPDGGWGYSVGAASNSSSTAWVLQALRARRHEAKAMTTNHRQGFHFLESVTERSIGAFRYDTAGTESSETLNTAYSIMALRGRPLPVNKHARLHR